MLLTNGGEPKRYEEAQKTDFKLEREVMHEEMKSLSRNQICDQLFLPRKALHDNGAYTLIMEVCEVLKEFEMNEELIMKLSRVSSR